MLLRAARRLATAPRSRAIASSAASLAASAATAAFSVIKPIGAGYAITLALALTFQRKLQYFPREEAPELSAFPVAYAAIEEHAIDAADGTRCYLWHWPAPNEADEPMPPAFLGPEASAAVHPVMRSIRTSHPSLRHVDLLLFHGNAGSRADRIYWMHLVREGLGCSVTVVDYRGYGGSHGSPTESGLLMDGAAAYNWLRERQKRPVRGGIKGSASAPRTYRRRPVLWGESIGTGVAVGLLAGDAGGGGGKQPPDDDAKPLLVLEAGFTSCADLGANAYPWLPVRIGMLDKFESEKRAQRMASNGEVGVPTLSLHGELDEIAPIELGRALYDAMPSPRKRWVKLPQTGHNDVPYHDAGRYLREVSKFLVREVEEEG